MMKFKSQVWNLIPNCFDICEEAEIPPIRKNLNHICIHWSKLLVEWQQSLLLRVNIAFVNSRVGSICLMVPILLCRPIICGWYVFVSSLLCGAMIPINSSELLTASIYFLININFMGHSKDGAQFCSIAGTYLYTCLSHEIFVRSTYRFFFRHGRN